MAGQPKSTRGLIRGAVRCGAQERRQGHQRRDGEGRGAGAGSGAGRAARRSASLWARASAAWARASAARTRAARSSSRTSSCAMAARATARSRAGSSSAGWAGRWASGGQEWASGRRCPVGAHWAPAQVARASELICQRFRLSRNAVNSPDWMARMMVRRLTFALWAACAGDRGAEMGAPSGRSVGKLGTAGEGRDVSSCRPRSRPVDSVRPPARACSRCPGRRPRASR